MIRLEKKENSPFANLVADFALSAPMFILYEVLLTTVQHTKAAQCKIESSNNPEKFSLLAAKAMETLV